MKLQKAHIETQKLTVMITASERDTAKAIAKSQGMTFAGWLGQLVKREIRSDQASIGISPLSNEIGTNPSSLDFGR